MMRYFTPPFHCRAAAMLPLLLMPPRCHYASPHSCHMLMNIDYASSYVLITPFSPRDAFSFSAFFFADAISPFDFMPFSSDTPLSLIFAIFHDIFQQIFSPHLLRFRHYFSPPPILFFADIIFRRRFRCFSLR
jgi:hypothetical protein